jgi:hypothetical protein
VFIATCYSQFAAEIFFAAGARYVIGIDKGYQVLDEAILTFAKGFYQRIFESGSTVCQSFKNSQAEVRMKFNKQEADKFVLFGDTTRTEVIGDFLKGEPTIHN